MASIYDTDCEIAVQRGTIDKNKKTSINEEELQVLAEMGYAPYYAEELKVSEGLYLTWELIKEKKWYAMTNRYYVTVRKVGARGQIFLAGSSSNVSFEDALKGLPGCELR